MKFQIVNPDKIIYPKPKVTKKEIIDYYNDVSEKMLPFLKNRLLAVQRFPDGINKGGFYQKNTPKYYPKWIKEKKRHQTNYTVCGDKKCLLYMVNQASIVFHSWLSKVNKPDYPDKIIFDLDPIDVDFDYVIKGALALKKILEPELKTYIMTTGSKGFHVVVPIKAESNFNEVKPITQKIAQLIAQANPDKYTTELRKEKRQGKVFIDYHRNTESQLAVVPYSLRAIENATIAMPIDWKDIKKIRPQDFTIKNYKNYNLNVWKDFFENVRSVKKLKEKVEKISK
ncbi:MAG: non-homologous end-joining DNA ligase [Nanoarchaeota archaeon]|nr:non-homologous end-joining DNA ligase [Nanoarchaeota archaeon]